MPKKNDQKGPNEPGKGKGGNKGKTRKGVKNKRTKKVKVELPMLYIDGKSHADENGQEAMTEAEVSYNDALMAVKLGELAAKGLNNKQIIEALGIHKTTFYEKVKNNPYFSYSLRQHRGILVHEVKNALAQNALGFTYLEQQGTAMGDVVTVMKQKLPETKAQEVLLYNLDPENWKRKPEAAVSKGNDISNITLVIKRRE